MQGLNQPLVSGVRTRVTCSSAGARPQPQIVWNKGGVAIRGASQTVSAEIYLYFSPISTQPLFANSPQFVYVLLCFINKFGAYSTLPLAHVYQKPAGGILLALR